MLIAQHKISLLKRLPLLLAVLALSIAPIAGINQAGAAQITNRSITLSSSAGAATDVTYDFASAALPTSGTAVKSVDIKFCTTSSGACTTPSGFSASASSLAAQPTGLGSSSGWTVNSADAGSLRITNAANATIPSGSVTISWSNVTNPTANNASFYGIATTYSDASWTTPIDSGTIVLSTSQQIQVALTVGESLTFCTGTSITGQNCGTVTGSLVNLGTGSVTASSTGTSVMAASTNASSGYSITVNGTTLASGANTITALSSGGTSSIGTKQFGLNLSGANTVPVVGAAVSGTGIGTAATNYGSDNNFRFATGEQVATSTGPTNPNAFTVSYLANIDGLTVPGLYNTTLTYIATANF